MWGKKKEPVDAVRVDFMSVAEHERVLRAKEAEYEDRIRRMVKEQGFDLKVKDQEHEFEVKSLQKEIDDQKEINAWKIEKAVAEAVAKLRKELQDEAVCRVDAEARLEAYEEYDAKHDRKQLEEHLSSLIKGVSEMLGRLPTASESRIVVEKS